MIITCSKSSAREYCPLMGVSYPTNGERFIIGAPKGLPFGGGTLSDEQRRWIPWRLPTIAMLSSNRFQDLLSEILSGYLAAWNERFDVNQLATVLRQDLPDAVRLVCLEKILSELKAQGSLGQGKWAECPWLRSFHPKETTSAQQGMYVVYLFAADMSAVFLTLNRGTSNLSSNDIENRRTTIQQKIDGLRGCEIGPLTTGAHAANSKRGQSYELACAYYKRYGAGCLPAE